MWFVLNNKKLIALKGIEHLITLQKQEVISLNLLFLFSLEIKIHQIFVYLKKPWIRSFFDNGIYGSNLEA